MHEMKVTGKRLKIKIKIKKKSKKKREMIIGCEWQRNKKVKKENC